MKCLPCIEHNLPSGTNRLKTNDVVLKVCEFMNTDVKDVLNKDRHNHVVRIRMMIAYLLKRDRYLNLSLKSIGYTIGKRDHTTVIHAIKRIEYDLDCYPEFRDILYDCFMYVYGSDAYFPEPYKKKIEFREAV